MSIGEERLKSILQYVATKCCMEDWKYKRGEITEIIENYVCSLLPIAVTGFVEGKERTQHVFIKLPSCDETVRSFDGYLWDTEVYIYETLVPTWKALTNVEMDDFIPLCYYADATPKDQVLVLKDMRYEGYRKYSERFLDFNHVTVSLKCLAKFHAHSIIMQKDQKPLDAYVLRPYTHDSPIEINIAMLNSFRAHSKLFKGSKYEEYLRDTLTNYETIVKEGTSNAKCLVYGHGDYWKGNILYKYENNNPIIASMFDFQCCRVMSPARDFLFFILNATNASLRRAHYKHFLTQYYVDLKSILCNIGVQLEKVYTMEDFECDLRVVASLCLIHVFMSFSLWLGFESEAIIPSKISWENQDQRDKNLRVLKEILEDSLQDLCTYGYITL